MGRRASQVIIVAVLLVAFGMYAWHFFNPGPMAFAGGSAVSLADYHAADPTGLPAELVDAEPIKRGEYLARAADCEVCHTGPGGAAYAGGLAFPLPFGTLYSTNITADKETGIGDYSDTEFLNAVRRGIRKDGARLYPAMPYPSYTYMTDADVLAIKTYLFSRQPVHATSPANTLGFPYNQRESMIVWSWFFNANSRFAPNTAQSPQWNRGAYLAEALAHCGECHTPRNLGFALDNRKKFAGAMTAGWHAFNITSDKGTGIGEWRDDDVSAYLSKGHALNRGTAAGPMGEAVDQSLSHMSESDIKALTVYLRSVPAIATPNLTATIAPPAPARPDEGSATADVLGGKVFQEACVSCHNWTGVSAISPYATIAGTRAVNDPAATNVAQIVITGTRRLTPRGVISMPAFGSAYSDNEIAAVANYVTGRFGSEQSRITDKDVAELRGETAR
jgi:mono/diheme cytochrome c family protein